MTVRLLFVAFATVAGVALADPTLAQQPQPAPENPDEPVSYEEQVVVTTMSGGVAGSEGMIHTGIGPFNVATGSRMSYFSTRYRKGGRRVSFFTNMLSGDAEIVLVLLCQIS